MDESNPKQPDSQANSQADLRTQIQTQIVDLITEKLKTGQLSEDRARQIAQLVLDKLPEGINQEELMRTLPKLDDHFRELSDVVLPIMVDYEQRLRAAIEGKVLELMRAERFQEALDTARKGIDYTSQVISGEAAPS